MEKKKYTTHNIEGYDLKITSEWTRKIEKKQHWNYYWHQASLVFNHIRKDQKILEVGVGSSFLCNYLQSRGWKVVTLDIDPDKKPDIVGDISSMDLSAISFDCLLAFEVFEHLPYPLFVRAVENICRAEPGFIIFSVPWGKLRLFDLTLQLPQSRPIEFGLHIRKPESPRFFIPTHFWELKKGKASKSEVVSQGKRGLVAKREVMDVFRRNGYSIEEGPKEDKIQFFLSKSVQL